MAGWEKWLWGGLGWAMGGPIGGIVGFALGSMSGSKFGGAESSRSGHSQTRPGDFGVSLMVLFAAVMRADDKLTKSELEYVKSFLIRTFGEHHARERMLLFKDILDQEYPLRDVCGQIRRHMDHPSRLELLHLLFGLAQADGKIDQTETEVIGKISGYLGISQNDLNSIKAMFVKDLDGPYQILEIDRDAELAEIKKAYRKMANKYHPDKVNHLGAEFLTVAEEKFKAINEAYHLILEERGA